MNFTNRECATVLAALRFWQRKGDVGAEPEWDIASDGDTRPLTAPEIDRLCERLNFREI